MRPLFLGTDPFLTKDELPVHHPRTLFLGTDLYVLAQVVALPVSISTAASIVWVPCLTYSLLQERGLPLRSGSTGWVLSSA